MDSIERYDELDNIVSSIRLLTEEITDKDYIEQLQLIQYQAMDEMEDLEEIIRKEQEAEEREMDYQYERMKI